MVLYLYRMRISLNDSGLGWFQGGVVLSVIEPQIFILCVCQTADKW